MQKQHKKLSVKFFELYANMLHHSTYTNHLGRITQLKYGS